MSRAPMKSNYRKFEKRVMPQSIKNDKNNNPIKQKTGRDIGLQMESDDKSRVFHSFCQPSFCAFYYGGHTRNCDGTVREGVADLDTHMMWHSPTAVNPFTYNKNPILGIDYGLPIE